MLAIASVLQETEQDMRFGLWNAECGTCLLVKQAADCRRGPCLP